MSFKKIKIQPNGPRDSKKAKISFTSGIRLPSFMGYFFLLVGFTMVIMTLFVYDMPLGAIPFGVAAVIGFLVIWRMRVNVSNRKLAYIHGYVCSGTVKSHSRKFSPFRSKQMYSVTLKLDKSEGVTKKRYKIIHPKEGIWRVANVNDQVYGLVHEGKYLFGPEVERVFEIDY